MRIAAFCLLFGVPGLLGAFGIRGIDPLPENRRLAELPWAAITIFDLAAAMRGFDAYIADHFGLRPLLITAVARFKLVFGGGNNSQVLFGRDGWMFLPRSGFSAKGFPTAADLADIRGVVSPDSAAISNWKTVFEQRQRWVERLGAKFVFVIPPDKAVIYPEFLPTWLRRRGAQTQLGWFLDAVKGSGMDILYLKDALLAKKGLGSLYYKFDIHWNNLGAFFGAGAIIDHLHSLDPRIPEFAVDHHDRQLLNGQTLHGGIAPLDLGIFLGLPFLTEPDERIIHRGGWTTKEDITNDGRYIEFIYTKIAPELPTLVVFEDSFGFPMRRFIAEYFRRSIFVPWVSIKGDEFPSGILKREKPDFFIFLRWEDGILGPTANPPEIVLGHALR
jgi:hypothetical protein